MNPVERLLSSFMRWERRALERDYRPISDRESRTSPCIRGTPHRSSVSSTEAATVICLSLRDLLFHSNRFSDTATPDGATQRFKGNALAQGSMGLLRQRKSVASGKTGRLLAGIRHLQPEPKQFASLVRLLEILETCSGMQNEVIVGKLNIPRF